MLPVNRSTVLTSYTAGEVRSDTDCEHVEL